MRTIAGLSVAVIALYLTSPASAADLAEAVPPARTEFSASVDFVYATREMGDNNIILQDTTTGGTILDSDNFDFGWEPGVDARLNASSGLYSFGLRFLGGFEFDDTTRITTPPIWNLPTNPPLFGLGVANVTSQYETSLNSGELNVSRLFGNHLAAFIGMRAIVVDEKLTNIADFGPNQATITIRADTAAVGPQLGGQFSFGDRLFVEGDGRIAALASGTDLSFSVAQAVGPAFTAESDNGNWLMLAEGGIAVGVKLGPSVSLRAGYRVLFIDDIPTATASIGKVQVLSSTIDDSSDQILVHGSTLGGKITF